jgi:acetyl/propionyl-CoA carboxylase alpha subunit
MSRLSVTIDQRTFIVEAEAPLPGVSEMTVRVDGVPVLVRLPEAGSPVDAIDWLIVDDRPLSIVLDHDLGWIISGSAQHRLEVRDLDAALARPRSGDGRVKAPIPGLITRVCVVPGQPVEAGQALCVLEAMKMENEIRAPRAGVVAALPVTTGQAVSLGQLLAEIN